METSLPEFPLASVDDVLKSMIYFNLSGDRSIPMDIEEDTGPKSVSPEAIFEEEAPESPLSHNIIDQGESSTLSPPSVTSDIPKDTSLILPNRKGTTGHDMMENVEMGTDNEDDQSKPNDIEAEPSCTIDQIAADAHFAKRLRARIDSLQATIFKKC
ncbi:uncharacterized protein [Primulina huaijiensis]|uniref:uncharacterized protein n=1 Tax=Primulina huaijiensis TaxID=1492673 RepID=UPI003CC7655E